MLAEIVTTDHITLLQALLLGIIEGVTEFLPISSTGHLLVSSQMLGAANTSGTFEIVIQLGAIVAVVMFYWKRLCAKIVDVKSNQKSKRFWINLFAAFLPAAVVGLALHDLIDNLLDNRAVQAYVIASTLVVGGIILWWVDEKVAAKEVAPEPLIDADNGAADAPNTSADAPNASADAPNTSVAVLADATSSVSSCDDMTLRQAVWIGIAQCFSLVPGVSRSGSTIVGALLVGLNRAQATEFSFFLSIPTLGAATLYTLVRHFQKLIEVGSLSALCVGTVVSFITAWLVIGWLLRYVANNDFKGFAVYRVVAGLLIAAWAYWYV